MLRRTIAIIAVGALGAGAGIATYAALDGGGGSTHTVTAAAASPAPTAASSSKTLSVNDIYRAAHDGVVEVDVTSAASPNSVPFGGQGTQEAEGSGFVYDSDGHVVTNNHVVDGATSIKVKLADGTTYSASLVGADPSSDLAVIKVDAPSGTLHPLSLGDSSKLEVGDGVVAIGSPFGLDETVTTGIVSALDRTIDAPNNYAIPGAIQTDAAINHGNSGGPLLDLQGDVIGVNSQIQSDSGGNDGVWFAIPSSTVKSVISQLVSGGQVQHAYLGVQITDASKGAKISVVKSGTPAAAAGLKAGDVISAVNGTSVSSADELRQAVDSRTPGTKVKLKVVRNGQTFTVTAKLGTRPS